MSYTGGQYILLGSPSTRTVIMVLAGILWIILFVLFWEPVGHKNTGSNRFGRVLLINSNAVKILRIRRK